MTREKLVKWIGVLNSGLHRSLVNGNMGTAKRTVRMICRAVEKVNELYPKDNPFYQHRSGLGIERVESIPATLPPQPHPYRHPPINRKAPRPYPKARECACGCGEKVGRPPAVFCRGHDAKIKKEFMKLSEGGPDRYRRLPEWKQVMFLYWEETGKLVRERN